MKYHKFVADPTMKNRIKRVVLSPAVITGSTVTNLAGGLLWFSELHNNLSSTLDNYMTTSEWPILLIAFTGLISPALTTGLAKRRYFLIGLMPLIFEVFWLMMVERQDPEATQAATYKLMGELVFWGATSWIVSAGVVALIKLAIRKAADKRAARIAAAMKPMTYADDVWPPPPEA